jgi:hypothetical protein
MSPPQSSIQQRVIVSHSPQLENPFQSEPADSGTFSVALVMRHPRGNNAIPRVGDRLTEVLRRVRDDAADDVARVCSGPYFSIGFARSALAIFSSACLRVTK